MTEAAALDAYGVVTAPATVRMERMLPGPIERIWAYLTESDLRRQWLASGPMELKVGGKTELVWRNDDLTPGDPRPPEFEADEHRMDSQITRIEAPRLLAFGWHNGSEVIIELEPVGAEVRLTLTHERLSGRAGMLGVSAGWHSHLDVLEARLSNRQPAPFWTNFISLRTEYDARLPAW